MKLSSIKDVVIAITYRCNSRCRMCSIWKNGDKHQEIRPDDLKGLPRTLKDINISGGEPFLHTKIGEIVEVLSIHCPGANIIISSNGFATDLIISQLEKIIKVKPDIGLAFSLDGVGQAHDSVRGVPGGFDKVIETIKQARKLGVKNIKIGFTLGDYNTGELIKVYLLARDLGAEFSFTVVHSAVNFFGQENKISDKNSMLNAIAWLIGRELAQAKPKNWARAYYAWGALHFVKTGRRLLPDYSGRYNIFIDPRGDVYPCDTAGTSIGELSQTGLRIAAGIKKDPACGQSWMICTARQAIKKHWPRAIGWIVINKIRSIF